MEAKQEAVAEAVADKWGGRATLVQAYNRGQLVWAAACPMHAAGLHRYTLSSGVACADWWPTLAAAAVSLAAVPELSTVQAAAALGIDPATVRQAIIAGRIKATKRGRDWWISGDEVARYMRERRGR